MKEQHQQQLHKITFNKKRRFEFFKQLSRKQKPYILSKLSKLVQRDLVSKLRNKALLTLLDQMDVDQATDIIQLLPATRQDEILSLLKDVDMKNTIEILKDFDPQTVAGIMNTNYIQVDADDSLKLAVKKFKIHEKRTGRLPVIIVVDDAKIKGYLPGHTLGLGDPTELVRKYMHKIILVKHNESHDKVMRIFQRHPHSKLAVLGDKRNVVGIIFSDDMLRLMQGQQGAALYDFAGVSDEETVLDPASKKIASRYKWLIANMATAFLAAFTVSIFEETIAKYVLLAVYMPIVAGMGGNAGTQTLAVLVRGIALKQIELKTARPTMKQEVLAALGNGLINGILVASIVLVFNKDWKIALILGIAMIFNLFVAAVFGTLVPLLMQRLGKDPATSATVFITTATDVLGFLAFLGLATLILP